SAELLHAIVDGLAAAGVKPANVSVFERYRANLESSPYPSWVPQNVNLAWAAVAFEPIQMGIEAYDPDCYVDLPFTLPAYSSRRRPVPPATRSLVAPTGRCFFRPPTSSSICRC